MNTLPVQCPFCSGELYATRLYCSNCDTLIEGRFVGGAASSLTAEQQRFIASFVTPLKPDHLTLLGLFIRCEGKINRMSDEMGVSYPTVRNRLDEVIRALGYEPDAEEPGALSESKRQKVLADLEAGQISAEEAMRKLQESEA